MEQQPKYPVTITKDGYGWGVFETEDPYTKHIAPVDDNGYVLIPHELTLDCTCDPLINTDNGSTLIIHNVVPVQ